MILIIDFASASTQLLARKIRERSVYCIIEAPDISIEKIKELKPKGIILSGSYANVHDENSPKIDPLIFSLDIPLLGISYGMQLMVEHFKGKTKKSAKREFFSERLLINKKDLILEGIKDSLCWINKNDQTELLPEDFELSASTESIRIAACAHKEKKLFGLHFLPENENSEEGGRIIDNFIKISQASKNWTMSRFAEKSIEEIKEKAGDKKVILGLSGGVDSSVAALLIHRAIGDNLSCIFVDTGLLRKNEAEDLKKVFKDNFSLNIVFADAKESFLNALEGISDPEKKRKIIGKLFIDIFEMEANKIKGAAFLAQGTLYPDIIESRPIAGGVAVKSHHNVGGLPENMQLKLLEPLQYLFKDEVRLLGEELGLPESMVWRQPFPGPGLAIRIMGEITEKRLHILKEADAILLEEVKNAGLYKKLWQSFAVLLPIQTVGVMNDKRSYENTCAIRAVESRDAVTAKWAHLPYELLDKISERIIREVDGINRVVYDISSKPPATIEWE